ncbi:MAG: hypothetical protein AB1938_05395 [Myxococcota bacterium]
MRPVALLVSGLVASGCSLLFDPSKVAPACPPTPPPGPASLVATVGEKSGRIAWAWPGVEGATAYRLCTSVPGGTERCRDVDAVLSCVGGACGTVDDGLTDGVRVTGVVNSLDDCDQASTSSAATASATPIDTSNASGWTLERGAGCATATPSVLGDTVALELTNLGLQTCLATLVTGDELWGDFTLEGELRFSALANTTIGGGFALHVNSTGYRLAAAAAADEAGGTRRSNFYRRKDGRDTVVATSIVGASGTGVTFLRLVSKGGWLSFQLGPSREAAREVMRVFEGARTGRIGIAGGGQGRFEVSHLRVTTAAELPRGGPVASQVDFSDGGLPARTLVPFPEALTVGPCPTYASGCASCAPPPGAFCGRCVRGPGFKFPTVAFDLPTGIDPRLPWHMTTRFAIPADAGASSVPVVLATPRNGLLAANNWTLPVGGLGQSYGTVLAPDTWHTAEWQFDADAGRWGIRLDGQAVTLADSTFPLADDTPHLGSFTWCDGLVNDLVLHEVSVSQP